MSKNRRKMRAIFSWLMVLCMVMTMGMFTAQTASADRGDTPEHHKMREGVFRFYSSEEGSSVFWVVCSGSAACSRSFRFSC